MVRVQERETRSVTKAAWESMSVSPLTMQCTNTNKEIAWATPAMPATEYKTKVTLASTSVAHPLFSEATPSRQISAMAVPIGAPLLPPVAAANGARSSEGVSGASSSGQMCGASSSGQLGGASSPGQLGGADVAVGAAVSLVVTHAICCRVQACSGYKATNSLSFRPEVVQHARPIVWGTCTIQ